MNAERKIRSAHGLHSHGECRLDLVTGSAHARSSSSGSRVSAIAAMGEEGDPSGRAGATRNVDELVEMLGVEIVRPQCCPQRARRNALDVERRWHRRSVRIGWHLLTLLRSRWPATADGTDAQYWPLITKNDPRMVPANFDFWVANLNRVASSSGMSIPTESLKPTARFFGLSTSYITLIESPLS